MGKKIEIPSVGKYRRRYKKFPEEAGWAVKDFQDATAEGSGITKLDYCLEFGAIAEAMGTSYEELDVGKLNPEDAVMAVMYKKDQKSYDWERFRTGRWDFLRHLNPL